jgi:ribonuclease BN (tRNA processing enzyme)
MKKLFVFILLLFSTTVYSTEISIQVLGSGGPIADDARASSGYVIAIDGKGRILIDAGGGVFQRFGEAGLKMDDLTFVGLTHFHTDHSSDFPALMKSAYFGNKSSPLYIAGPATQGKFPGLNDWLSALFAPGKGAYAYLSGYIDEDADPFALLPVEVSLAPGKPAAVVGFESFAVTAMPIPHGPVPSLAYWIQIGDIKIVVSGDQNLSDPAFVEFVKNADLWLMPLPIPENAGRIARNLHALPSKIGAVAATAGVKALLLSHFMARSLADLDINVALVKKQFKGQLLLAEDLQQWSLGQKAADKGWFIAP